MEAYGQLSRLYIYRYTTVKAKNHSLGHIYRHTYNTSTGTSNTEERRGQKLLLVLVEFDIMSHVASTGKSALKQLENARSLAADWMKAEDFDSSAWRLTLTAEAKENIEGNAGESDVDASNPRHKKEAPRLRRNNQRRLKREKCEQGLRGLRGETGERGERGEKGEMGEAGPPGLPGQSASKMWANAFE
eukprot:g74702.t1